MIVRTTYVWTKEEIIKLLLNALGQTDFSYLKYDISLEWDEYLIEKDLMNVTLVVTDDDDGCGLGET